MDTWVMDKHTEAGVVTAITPKGETVVLMSDPDGDFIVVEQIRFLGADPHVAAHRLGPGDRPRPEYTRFSRIG